MFNWTLVQWLLPSPMSLTKPDQHFQYHGEVPPYPGTPQVLPIKLVAYCTRLIMFLCSLQTLPLVVFQWRPSQGQVGLPPEKPSNLVLTSSAPVLGGRTMSCCVPSREINILLILSIVLILQGCLFPCTNVWLVYCKETISSSFFSIDNQSFFFISASQLSASQTCCVYFHLVSE